MSRRPANRMADPLNRSQEAMPVLLQDAVPALTCPACGRGMQPLILRRRADGERDCQCSSCGREFVYTPPFIRLKDR